MWVDLSIFKSEFAQKNEWGPHCAFLSQEIFSISEWTKRCIYYMWKDIAL